MDMSEASHSFIVKVWLEKPLAESGEVQWRGHVTHIPSKERRYFKDLNEVAEFIVPYLGSWGATSPSSPR